MDDDADLFEGFDEFDDHNKPETEETVQLESDVVQDDVKEDELLEEENDPADDTLHTHDADLDESMEDQEPSNEPSKPKRSHQQRWITDKVVTSRYPRFMGRKLHNPMNRVAYHVKKIHQYQFDEINANLNLENSLVTDNLLDAIHTYATKLVSANPEYQYEMFKKCSLYAIGVVVSEWILHASGSKIDDLDRKIEMWTSISKYYDNLLLKKRRAEKLRLNELNLFNELAQPHTEAHSESVKQFMSELKTLRDIKKRNKPPETLLAKRPVISKSIVIPRPPPPTTKRPFVFVFSKVGALDSPNPSRDTFLYSNPSLTPGKDLKMELKYTQLMPDKPPC